MILCGNTCKHNHDSLNGPTGCCAEHGPYMYFCNECHQKKVLPMKKKQVHKGRTIHEYEVWLTEKELANNKKPWTDQEIIDFCDPGNFGGRVLFFPHDNHYQVWVYTD